MDLIRHLLLQIEAAGPHGLNQISSEAHDEGTIEYHMNLLINARFVDGKLEHTFGRNIHLDIKGLTWAGHDFLEAIKNDTVWNRTKSFIAQKGGGATIEIMRSLAVSFAKAHFDLPA
jgi:hypothetical protein